MAIVEGSSHDRSGVECQDFGGVRFLTDTAEAPLLLFVADGAGSAARSREGAEFVCNQFATYFSDFFASGGVIPEVTRSICEAWITETREALRSLASSEDASLRDFACTFLGAILGKSGSRFLQVGDGAIVYSDERDQYGWVAWPEQTEYTNVTYFVTQDGAEAHLQFEKGGPDVVEVAIFSDGIQRLALQMATRQVHDPFFRHVFSNLRTEEPGISKKVGADIADLLKSPAVLSRTDDDKTLVLATRLCLEDPSSSASDVTADNGELKGAQGLSIATGNTGVITGNAG